MLILPDTPPILGYTANYNSTIDWRSNLDASAFFGGQDMMVR